VRIAYLASVLLLLVSCKAVPVNHPPVFVPPPPSAPTDQAPICAKPEEVAAFQAVGLQTELMQTALSCKGDDKYGVFVNTYKSNLVDARDVLEGFFKRAYGTRFQTHYDSYITQLANTQSQHNLKSGIEYCEFGNKTLDQASALKTPGDLTQYEAKVPIQQSLNVQACGSPGAPPEEPVTTKRMVKKHRR